MNRLLSKYLLMMISLTFSFVINASTQDLTNITTTELTKKNQHWFLQEFPRSFMSVYKTKVFFINGEEGPVLLGLRDDKKKNTWLLETAKDEFQEYVVKPQMGYKALLIEYNHKPIGALLYRLLENEKTIYLAQYFIEPEYQKKGIGEYILLEVLPSQHPNYKRYEILARHQNDAAFLLYRKAGFAVGDVALVQKYNYDPLRYMSFYKNF